MTNLLRDFLAFSQKTKNSCRTYHFSSKLNYDINRYKRAKASKPPLKLPPSYPYVPKQQSPSITPRVDIDVTPITPISNFIDQFEYAKEETKAFDPPTQDFDKNNSIINIIVTETQIETTMLYTLNQMTTPHQTIRRLLMNLMCSPTALILLNQTFLEVTKTIPNPQEMLIIWEHQRILRPKLLFPKIQNATSTSLFQKTSQTLKSQ